MYDLEYLKNLHFRITRESIEEKGYTEEFVETTYNPGVFRQAVEPGNARGKRRYFPKEGAVTTVFYSSMDDATIEAMEAMLRSINTDELSKLSCEDFAEKMADLYADMDYCHPFYEGNSRTLRAFIADVAGKSGFFVDWERTNQNEETRDLLYAARDVAVCKISLDYLRKDGLLRLIAEQTIETLKNYKSLAELFVDITQQKSHTQYHQRSADNGIELD